MNWNTIANIFIVIIIDFMSSLFQLIRGFSLINKFGSKIFCFFLFDKQIIQFGSKYFGSNQKKTHEHLSYANEINIIAIIFIFLCIGVLLVWAKIFRAKWYGLWIICLSNKKKQNIFQPNTNNYVCYSIPAH